MCSKCDELRENLEHEVALRERGDALFCLFKEVSDARIQVLKMTIDTCQKEVKHCQELVRQAEHNESVWFFLWVLAMLAVVVAVCGLILL